MTEQQIGIEWQQVIIAWKLEVVHTCSDSDSVEQSSRPE